MKNSKKKARLLRDQMSLLSDLVKTLKSECTHAKMWAFQSSRTKALITNTLLPLPYGDEAMLEVWLKGMVKEATS